MKSVLLITDGACIGNPGPGGWACILRYGNHKKELYGAEPHTTNNRMELRAAVEGLRALKEPCEVEVTTDSEYLKNGITNWIHGWKRNGWITAAKTPVVNQDLWQQLDEAVSRHRMRWTWTRGHASHEDNNRCDELATQAAREQIYSFTVSERPPVVPMATAGRPPAPPSEAKGGRRVAKEDSSVRGRRRVT